jgi:hypothetical protein
VHLIAVQLSHSTAAVAPHGSALVEVLWTAAAVDDQIKHIWAWSSKTDIHIALFCLGPSAQLALERCWIVCHRALQDSPKLLNWEIALIRIVPLEDLDIP